MGLWSYREDGSLLLCRQGEECVCVVDSVCARCVLLDFRGSEGACNFTCKI